MSKQKLVYKTEKDGWYVLNENGDNDFKLSRKMISALDSHLDPSSENEVEVNNDKSIIKLVGTQYYIEKSDDQGGYTLKKEEFEMRNNRAHAPYNFVDIGNRPLFFEKTGKKHDSLSGYSGYIDIEIETLTPTFIGYQPSAENSNHILPFEINGKPAIPGSSIRGMLRALMQVLTYSEFKLFDMDRKLFFRSVATDRNHSFLNDQYDKEGIAASKVGIMVKRNNKYFIHPVVIPDDCTYEIKLGDRSRYVREWDESNERSYETLQQEAQDSRDKKEAFKRAKNEIANNLEREVKPEYHPFQYEVNDDKITWFSGWMKHKRVKYVIQKDWINTDHLLEIPEKLIKSYQQDSQIFNGELNKKEEERNGEKHIDLLQKCENLNIDEDLIGVPVFYLLDEDQISHFGHTKYSRRPYKNSVGDLVPKARSFDEKVYDLDTLLFGDTENWASRLSFTDAKYSEENKDKSYMEAINLKPLLAPKPTSFQLYLKQQNSRGGYTEHASKSYDSSDAELRGYKFYFHRPYVNDVSGQNEITANNFNESINKTIQPISIGKKFNSRIYFQNLRKFELGALLFALKLPEGGAYKIGMAKPFGFGSINIKPKLKVHATYSKNVSFHFKKIVKNDMLYSGKPKFKEDDFLSCYVNGMNKELKRQHNQPYAIYNWSENERLSSLKHLLQYEERGTQEWYDITNYMGNAEEGRLQGTALDAYKNRWVLPEAKEVSIEFYTK